MSGDRNTRRTIARGLRSAGNRKGAYRKPPGDDSKLVQAALRGEITAGDFDSGTKGYQAVGRAGYLRSRAKRPELSAREATGHRVSGSRPTVTSFFTDLPPRLITLEGVRRIDVQRGGKYMAAVKNLGEARKSGNSKAVAEDFERRIARWRPIAGYPLLSDPEAVLAVAERVATEDAEVIFDSGRSRPTRRRRVKR